MPSVYILTLGCPKNETDSERFAGCFASSGWVCTESADEADLLLLNTCAFIRPAIEESLEALEDVIEWKNSSSGRQLILAGCLPGRFPDDGSGGLGDFELVIGPGDTDGLSSWLGRKAEPFLPVAPWKSYRYLRIADGCSNRCSYCTIPMIRGDFSPIGYDLILAEMHELAAQGAREIGLVAQDTALWQSGNRDLVDLLDEFSLLYPDIWWRVYYLHPAHFPERILGLMEDRDNVMPYIDMPIQHASSAILRRMGRSYDIEDLRRIMEEIEASKVEIAVRTTVITGYPGESDSDFETMLDFLCSCRSIRNLVVFPWYPEEGTVEYTRAGRLNDIPPPDSVSERLSILSSVSEGFYDIWAELLEGRRIRVLADTPEKGHTVWDAPDIDGCCSFFQSVMPGTVVNGVIVKYSGSDMVLDTGN